MTRLLAAALHYINHAFHKRNADFGANLILFKKTFAYMYATMTIKNMGLETQSFVKL
jgi:hypothetical protein